MKLPIISGNDLIKFLSKKGFEAIRQKGSHVRLKKISYDKVLVTIVPLHNEIDPRTLLSILKQCEIKREELFEWLK